jgi:hypothetical protein
MANQTNPPKRMKRPSYRDAIAWIGENDSAGDDSALDPEMVHSYVTVGFVADMFGVEQEKVAADVVKYRQRKAAKK